MLAYYTMPHLFVKRNIQLFSFGAANPRRRKICHFRFVVLYFLQLRKHLADRPVDHQIGRHFGTGLALIDHYQLAAAVVAHQARRR